MHTLLCVCALGLFLATPCGGGKVLVYPVDGSHWINMKVLIEELHARGHSVTVIRPSTSMYIKEVSPLYTAITIPQENDSKTFFEVILQKQLKAQHEGTSVLTFITLTRDFYSMVTTAHSICSDMLAQILDSEALVKSLQDAKYDLVLTDPAMAQGVVLAKYLKLPLVLNVRWFTSGDGHFVIAPSPLSYIPVPGSSLTDKMSFTQRVKNMISYGVVLFLQRLLEPGYAALCEKYIEGGCDISSLLQEADIWLFRSDFVFDFPRPTMPNMVYIGGFQCEPAHALPGDLEAFVQSAGEHGVIVMSLGTLINTLPRDVTEDIARVFAKLPQKVIWRHVGQQPSTLGNNTLITDWFPQKDLLGHPQTKVFVAHGGTNGVQEAIYYGVPVLGIPLFFDQFDNLLRLQERGAAKVIQLADVSGRHFEQGLKEVLHKDSYRQNMQRLSRLHKDKLITPKDSAIFWLEFVMRHGGAAHLRTEAYRMPWYSYYSVDVVAVLLAAIALLMLSTYVMFRFLCCRGRQKQKSKQH